MRKKSFYFVLICLLSAFSLLCSACKKEGTPESGNRSEQASDELNESEKETKDESDEASGTSDPADESSSEEAESTEKTSDESKNSAENATEKTTEASAPTAPQATSVDGKALVEYAKSLEGLLYVPGGSSLQTGMDYGHLISELYGHFGVSLPTNCADLTVNSHYQQVTGNQCLPGDYYGNEEYIELYCGKVLLGMVPHYNPDSNGTLVDVEELVALNEGDVTLTKWSSTITFPKYMHDSEIPAELRPVEEWQLECINDHGDHFYVEVSKLKEGLVLPTQRYSITETPQYEGIYLTFWSNIVTGVMMVDTSFGPEYPVRTCYRPVTNTAKDTILEGWLKLPF